MGFGKREGNALAMRILHCVPSMGGGGAERQLSYLAGELTTLGWDVHVALVAGGPNLARLRRGGAVIHQLAARGNHDPRILWQLLGVMRRVKPDLVQVWMVQMEILGGLAAEMKRVPWIFSERSGEAAYPPSTKNRLRVVLAPRASAVVSNSSWGDEYWQLRTRERVARYVIRNALPLDEIDALQRVDCGEIGLGPEQKVILFAGRFSEEKNLRTLLSALEVVLSPPQTVAVLCGDGPLRSEIERTVGERGIADGVWLPGYIDNVWCWMKRADVFVSPGLFEGHPNAVLEAMACGCPLVVSDIPAHREFLDERSALLVEPHDARGLAEAIMSVLAAPGAAAERARVARGKVAHWSTHAIALQYDEMYREVLIRCGRAVRGSS